MNERFSMPALSLASDLLERSPHPPAAGPCARSAGRPSMSTAAVGGGVLAAARREEFLYPLPAVVRR
ncbi:MAG: hypothetical protein V5B33_18755 [Candidatus Accumulibacter sp. UW20]